MWTISICTTVMFTLPLPDRWDSYELLSTMYTLNTKLLIEYALVFYDTMGRWVYVYLFFT